MISWSVRSARTIVGSCSDIGTSATAGWLTPLVGGASVLSMILLVIVSSSITTASPTTTLRMSWMFTPSVPPPLRRLRWRVETRPGPPGRPCIGGGIDGMPGGAPVMPGIGGGPGGMPGMPGGGPGGPGNRCPGPSAGGRATGGADASELCRPVPIPTPIDGIEGGPRMGGGPGGAAATGGGAYAGAGGGGWCAGGGGA